MLFSPCCWCWSSSPCAATSFRARWWRGQRRHRRVGDAPRRSEQRFPYHLRDDGDRDGAGVVSGVAPGYFLFRRRDFALAYSGWLAALFAAPVFLLYPLFMVIFGRNEITLIIMGFLPGVISLIIQVEQRCAASPHPDLCWASFDVTAWQFLEDHDAGGRAGDFHGIPAGADLHTNQHHRIDIWSISAGLAPSPTAISASTFPAPTPRSSRRGDQHAAQLANRPAGALGPADMSLTRRVFWIKLLTILVLIGLWEGLSRSGLFYKGVLPSTWVVCRRSRASWPIAASITISASLCLRAASAS